MGLNTPASLGLRHLEQVIGGPVARRARHGGGGGHPHHGRAAVGRRQMGEGGPVVVAVDDQLRAMAGDDSLEGPHIRQAAPGAGARAEGRMVDHHHAHQPARLRLNEHGLEGPALGAAQLARGDEEGRGHP